MTEVHLFFLEAFKCIELIINPQHKQVSGKKYFYWLYKMVTKDHTANWRSYLKSNLVFYN